MQKKGLILLDIDQTIVDEQYALTEDLGIFRAEIAATQSAGFEIGLSSDSAMSTIKRYAKLWGIDGPFVAERGAIISHDHQSPDQFLNKTTNKFPDLRHKFIRTLIDASSYGETLVVCGDVNEFSHNLPLLSVGGHSVKTAILINGMRRASISFYIRTHEESGWRKDGDTLATTIDLLRRCISDFSELRHTHEIEVNDLHGLCIVHHQETKKSLAVEHLCRSYPDTPIFMIGDSVSDLLGHQSVRQCAVGNAQPEYKESCTIVSHKNITGGVIELLGKIRDI